MLPCPMRLIQMIRAIRLIRSLYCYACVKCCAVCSLLDFINNINRRQTRLYGGMLFHSCYANKSDNSIQYSFIYIALNHRKTSQGT